MTALGKILVFVVLLLALVWNALVVNAYVTRSNWKKAFDDSQANVSKASEAANAERVRADRSREAQDAVILQLREEVARLKTTEKSLNEAVKDAETKAAAFQAVEQKVQTRDENEKANAKKTQDQVDILQKELNSSEKSRNDALIAEQKAKNDALQSKIDADSARRRADELEAKLLIARDPNRGAGGVGAIRPTVDKDFRAIVKEVNAEGLVTINLGSNAKLAKGVVLSIARYKPNAKYVGTLTITSVDPFYATGRFAAPATIAKPGPDDLPKPGDEVLVIE
jgi:hypothetical protein